MNTEMNNGGCACPPGSKAGMAMSPAKIFFGGLIMGFFVLCTIGFFILLPMVLKGASFGGSQGTNYGDTVGLAPSPAPAAAANIVLPPLDEKTDHITGAKKPKVTVYEYSDFECPFCGNFYPTVKQLMQNYGDDVRLVYRHFPLSFHPQATPAAEASECAAEQGKFWEFHDELFTNQARLGAALFTETATKLRLNMNKFNDCVSTHKYAQKVIDQTNGGAGAGVGGTPHTIVVGPNGEMVPVSGAQPYSVLEAAVKQFLN